MKMQNMLVTLLYMANLIYAQSQVKFFNQFKSEDFVVDLFKTNGTNVNRGNGGNITRMNIDNVPALLGQKFSFAAILLEPCAINLPHTHPRATEGLFVSEGEDILVGFILENGGKVFTNVLRKGMATFFPQGSIHFELNQSCNKSILIPAFNSEDPGVQTTANNLFKFGDDVLEATTNLTQQQIELIRNVLPVAPGLGLDECLIKCGLKPSPTSTSTSTATSTSTRTTTTTATTTSVTTNRQASWAQTMVLYVHVGDL